MTVGPGIQAQSALPLVPAANQPAWVRQGSAQVKHAYEQGLGFEEMLLEELSQSMLSTAGLGEEGAEGQEGGEAVGGSPTGAGGSALGAGGAGAASTLLPRVLAESLVKDGGLGLASQLAHERGGSEASEKAAAAAGVAAPASSERAAAGSASGAASAGGAGAPGQAVAPGGTPAPGGGG